MIGEQYRTKAFTDNSQYVENNGYLGNNTMQTHLWTKIDNMLRTIDSISRNIEGQGYIHKPADSNGQYYEDNRQHFKEQYKRTRISMDNHD
ncbi:hypothetical protein KUTeg_004044 [Tegillarca granosa]|uniref:Uncharacterized protein n=1 Tax=Tegillarca granosa TaxID=220873 RepID=A0ABQ9FNX8_TEGGR|nr:hypothetical protein KUTeg_004044 [Tegillarca granosa]